MSVEKTFVLNSDFEWSILLVKYTLQFVFVALN